MTEYQPPARLSGAILEGMNIIRRWKLQRQFKHHVSTQPVRWSDLPAPSDAWAGRNGWSYSPDAPPAPLPRYYGWNGPEDLR